MTTSIRLRRQAATLLATATVALAVPTAAQAVPQPVDSSTGSAESWSARLARSAGQQVNIRHRDGALRIADTRQSPASVGTSQGYASEILASHRLGRPQNRVRASASAQLPAGSRVSVDVRGRSAGGSWTGWQPAGSGTTAVFTHRVEKVQARITLTAGHAGSSPAVRSVRFIADRTAPRAQPRLAVGAHIFATREGLVGGTTANGHVIVANDHFVALPSSHGLSPRDTTDYSVHICNPANGVCLDAPVWDIGPWNTHDDYWSTSAQRENWQDLPQGTPEAQAAYQNGYNGGLDQFGRTVLNPAGIDLADGTFADLGLSDNGYVDVTYLWTAAG